MKKTIISILFFTYFIFFSFLSYSQKNIESYFDEILRKENLTISNGKLFVNNYKTTETDQFYNNKYLSETLSYKNETYRNINLKYDIFRDILIFKPYGESENFGVELITKNVDSFTIKNKQFVNLGNRTKDSIEFVKGFFEENYKSEKLSFYIKHKKETKEFIDNQRIFNSFLNYNKYVLSFNNNYYEIKSAKDLMKIFPDLKKDIKEFNDENNSLLKENKDAFFEKMIKKISALIQ